MDFEQLSNFNMRVVCVRFFYNRTVIGQITGYLGKLDDKTYRVDSLDEETNFYIDKLSVIRVHEIAKSASGIVTYSAYIEVQLKEFK